jgi:hypothetical protein
MVWYDMRGYDTIMIRISIVVQSSIHLTLLRPKAQMAMNYLQGCKSRA